MNRGSAAALVAGTLAAVSAANDEPQVDDDPELLALAKYALISGLAGWFLWHQGGTADATWASVLLHIGGGLCFLVTVWSGVWLVALGVMTLLGKGKRRKR